jgi:hypothetical protein
MSRAWKVAAGILTGLVLALLGYIGGRSKLGALLVPNAAAQTAPSNITLAKPSCVMGAATTGTGANYAGPVNETFACVADLDGNGKQEIVVGVLIAAANPEWVVHIVDGSGTERGTGTKLPSTP